MHLSELNFMLFIIFVFAWVIVTYKLGAWKNWRLYYSTILFFCLGNLIGFEVFHNKILWEFKSNILDHVAIDLIQMIFIFTCSTILYLHYYPKRLTRQILYILVWVGSYSVIEYFFYLIGSIKYYHGWGIWWSVLHNIYQFILLRIHYKNPLLAWLLSFIILSIVMSIFRVQL